MLIFSDWNNYKDDSGNARTLDWTEAGMRGAPAYPYCEAIFQAFAMRRLAAPNWQLWAHGSPDLRDVASTLRTIAEIQQSWLTSTEYRHSGQYWIDCDIDLSLGAMGVWYGISTWPITALRVLTEEEFALLSTNPMSKFGIRAEFLRIMRKVFLKWRRGITDVGGGTNYFKDSGSFHLTWADALAAYTAAPVTIWTPGQGYLAESLGRWRTYYGYQLYSVCLDINQQFAAGGPFECAAAIPYSVTALSIFYTPDDTYPGGHQSAFYSNNAYPYTPPDGNYHDVYRSGQVTPLATTHNFFARWGYKDTYGDYPPPDAPLVVNTANGFEERGRLVFDYDFPL